MSVVHETGLGGAEHPWGTECSAGAAVDSVGAAAMLVVLYPWRSRAELTGGATSRGRDVCSPLPTALSRRAGGPCDVSRPRWLWSSTHGALAPSWRRCDVSRPRCSDSSTHDPRRSRAELTSGAKWARLVSVVRDAGLGVAEHPGGPSAPEATGVIAGDGRDRCDRVVRVVLRRCVVNELSPGFASALGLSLLIGCGAGHAEPTTREAAEPSTGGSAAPVALLFAARVPLGEGDTSRLYVVLDETRGGDARGEPAVLGDDGVMRASSRELELASLDPTVRGLLVSRAVAVGPAVCAGSLGAPIELTLRDVTGDRVLATVIAAPLEGQCDQDVLAFHVEGAPPARVYTVDTDVEIDSVDSILAVVRALPLYAQMQAAYAAEVADVEGDEVGRWDEDSGEEPTIEVLRDGLGHELVRVRVGGVETNLTAVLEHDGDTYTVRAVGPEVNGLIVDVEGDGALEIVHRRGLSQNGVTTRSFERSPFVEGC